MEETEQQARSSLTSLRLHYDVFISFRGEDTRKNITTNLYNALYAKGIRVFIDTNGLRQGDEIAPGLVEAINDSAACIAIISPNYASSRWCLEELAMICELDKLVLPVFYHVDPSDVRRQKGPFWKDFENLEGKYGVEKVVRWRNAMERVGGRSGWVYYNRLMENASIQPQSGVMSIKLGMEFASDEHAYDYYNEYAAAIDFSVRKDYANKNRVHGYVTSRKLTCYKEGHRDKDKRDPATVTF